MQIELKVGQILVSVGDPVDQLYLIRTGQLAAVVPGIDHELRFGPGAIVGLNGVLGDGGAGPHRAQVRAIEPATVEVLDAAQIRVQFADLSKKMRLSLLAMFRAFERIVEDEDTADRRATRRIRKAERELRAALGSGRLQDDTAARMSDGLKDLQGLSVAEDNK
ncbi:cyclic nucleotide-binding domain-containing protein [Thalassobaculum sp.]|uniref:cyclic nucleotide-binding domain-containing protein n=1 Tax=Thalassobaculum sp. TaxID=2022740 RepID=UPI0032F044DF